MNIFKKGFLSLSLMIVGILVGTSLQANNGYISIKNNYRSPVRLVSFTSSNRGKDIDLNPGQTKDFPITKYDSVIKKNTSIEDIRIREPLPSIHIVREGEIKEHPNESLEVIISSDWLGNWKIEKNWEPYGPLSEDDFTEV